MKKKVVVKTVLPNEIPFYLRGNFPVLIISLLAFLIYLPTLWYGFSPMDERWIILNQKELMSHLGNFPDLFKNSLMGMYYRPICVSSFMFDMVLGNGSPFIFHFTNILLHVLCSILLFKFLLQLNITKEIAFVCALIFAVHPINVHTVAWIPGRNDSLLCLFTLLSCSQLLLYFNTKKIIYLLIHLLVFTLALFSKENSIVLPFLYFLIWLLFQKEKQIRTLIAPALSWLAIGIIWFFIRKSFVDYFPPVSSVSLGNTLLNFLKSLTFYTGKIILPIQQSVFPVLRDMSVIPFLIVTLILIILTLKFGLRDKKTALFGLIWFYIFLIIPAWVGATNTNGDQYEHRIYTSLFGAFLFLSQLKINFNPVNARKFVVLILIVFSAKTLVRCGVYESEFSFAEAATIESPSVALFHDMLGYMYCQKSEFRTGIDNFNEAIKLNPHKIEFYNNRGDAYFEIKDYRHALEDDNKVLELKKDQPQTLVNRSIANYYLGNHKAALDDLEEARKYGAANVSEKYVSDLYAAFQNDTINLCSQQLAKDSLDASTYNLRGIARLRLNQFAPAIADFNRALQLKPEVDAYRANRNLAIEMSKKK